MLLLQQKFHARRLDVDNDDVAGKECSEKIVGEVMDAKGETMEVGDISAQDLRFSHASPFFESIWSLASCPDNHKLLNLLTKESISWSMANLISHDLN